MGPLNLRFNAENIANSELNPPDAFAEGTTLSELVEDEPWVPQADVVDYLDSIPSGIQEAIRAVIREDLQRENPVPITFAWQPGYDWELTVNDVSDTAKTRGGITMIVRSRYPHDLHPMDPNFKA
jgi:hypothetical protein